MSTIACLVLLALVGALCSGDRVRGTSEEASQPPARKRCYVAGNWYNNGDLTGDACNRCRCSNGHQKCNTDFCFREDGENIPTPR